MEEARGRRRTDSSSGLWVGLLCSSSSSHCFVGRVGDRGDGGPPDDCCFDWPSKVGLSAILEFSEDAQSQPRLVDHETVESSGCSADSALLLLPMTPAALAIDCSACRLAAAAADEAAATAEWPPPTLWLGPRVRPGLGAAAAIDRGGARALPLLY